MPLWRCCLTLFLVSGSWFVDAPPSDAQSSDAPAILTGAVDDPSGARIPRASVHIHSDKLDHDTSTNATGTFTVTLPGGTYTITVRAAGFRELSRDTTLQAGSYRTLNLRLAIDAAAEVISVDPWADATDKQDTLSLSGNQLEILSDDPEALRQQLLAMAGGGTDLAAPQFYVDGFSNGQVPPKSAIRAIHINNDPYSTVHDRPSFGRVDIETLAGGNRLHGMFDVGGTGSALNSGNPYARAQPPYYQLLVRGNMSGPIGKNTSYFFAGNTSDLQNNAIVNAATLSEAVPNPLRDDDYSLRLDHRFSTSNQVNGRYEIHRLHQTNAGVGLLVLPTEGYTNNALTQTLQLADNEIFNPKIVNDLRFQYIRTRIVQDPNSSLPTIIVEGAFSGGGSPTQMLRDNQDQYELQENLSVDHGSHFIRTGLRYRLFRDSNDSHAGYNGQFIFPDIASYEASTPTPTQFSITMGKPNAAASTGDLSLYAEDNWKISRSFTLDYGLRYETQSAVPDHNDPAPRVGFAWAIGPKAAKIPILTLRGGAGIFYQRLTAADLLPSVRQDGVHQVAYFIQNPTSICPTCPTMPPLTSSLTATEPTIYRIDPRLRTSRSFVSSITAERMIGHIGNIALNYMEADGRHDYLLINANSPFPGTFHPTDPSGGVRPLGGTGNTYQYTSEGTGHAQTFFTNLNLRPTQRLYLFAFYVAGIDRSDSNGTSWFVSNSYNIRQDYGRDDLETGQSFYTGAALNLRYGLTVQPFVSVRSGRPFDITAGTDLNGDTIFNDRPAFATDLARPSVVRTAYGNFDTAPMPSQTIIPYNYGHGPGLLWVDLQMSEVFHVGPRPAMRVAPQTAVAADARPVPHTERPWTLSLSVETQNLFNHVNPSQPIGVLSSPLFGRSLSVATDFSTLTAANRTVLLHSTFTF